MECAVAYSGACGSVYSRTLNTRMIYRFEPSCAESVLDRILEWQWHRADVDMWRGRSDVPGQYRFDWCIQVSGQDEVLFLLLFADCAVFSAEPDYRDVLV